MAAYYGDFARLENVTIRFDTTNASGAMVTLAGTPSAQVRKGNASGTTSTAGVTLTVDVVTGQHCVDVFLSDAFYAIGEEYTVELAAGTVDGVSVVGRVLGSFSIVNRSTALIEANIIAELADLETKIDTIDDFLDTEIASIISTLAGVPTANQNADALLDRTDAVETAWTPRKVLRIMAAAVAGKVSGSPTAPVFRNITDTKARITATCSLAGDRTVVTLDGT